MSIQTRGIGILAVLALVACAVLLRGQDVQPQFNGRFQIFQGEYIVVSGSQGFTEKGVFRTDTVTGRASKFAAGLREGKLFQEWRPVSE
jgi:hypothetical protein